MFKLFGITGKCPKNNTLKQAVKSLLFFFDFRAKGYICVKKLTRRYAFCYNVIPIKMAIVGETEHFDRVFVYCERYYPQKNYRK